MSEKIHEEAKEGLHRLWTRMTMTLIHLPNKKQRSKGRDRFAAMLESDVLDTKFLEGEVLCESVGSILSSTLGVEYWPGYVDKKDLREIVTQSSKIFEVLPLTLPLHRRHLSNSLSNRSCRSFESGRRAQ